MIDSLRQVQVVSALARLAGNGGWAAILAGRELETDLDLADLHLLVAAGVLREREGRLEPVDFHPWYDDPEVLASGLNAELRRALQHSGDAEGLGAGVDPDEVVAMGVASRSVAAILADSVLPMLPTTRDRLAAGDARFLDVGVGTGAIAQTLCREFPGTTALGLDVAPEALEMAEKRLADSPVAAQVELRLLSVVDLDETDEFDPAWLPQIFLSRHDLELGLGRVLRALRPGCWLVMPVAACATGATALEAAALELDAVLRGGGPMSVESASALLQQAGFTEVRDMQGVAQSLVMARKPA